MNMPELSLPTQKLINKYQNWLQSLQPKKGEITIRVDEVTSKVASFYEKIREIVDWREEHLMRRIAIERILKRRLLFKNCVQNVAESFVLELIRGGHFPNNYIKKSKINQVQNILNKYTFILKNAPPIPKSKTQSEFYTNILSVAACEIEETLDPSLYARENALIDYMSTIMRERIKIGKYAMSFKKISEEEKNIQIYVAVQQALFKLDEPIVNYNLLKYLFPDWVNLSSSRLEEITKAIHDIWAKLNNIHCHFLADKFYKICERYDTAYLILGDIITENPMEAEENLRQPTFLEEAVKKAYNRRLKTLRSRTNRSAFYSTLSIFLTNIFSLYVLEFPFSKYVMGHISCLAAILDVAMPTFLMFLLVATIRLPSKKNLELVIEEVKKIVYKDIKYDVYEVELYPQRFWLLRVIFKIFYTMLFFFCYGVIIFFLYKLQYPPLSCLLLLMFTSLIAFTGVKIRRRAQELHITEPKETFFGTIIETLAIPIIRTGKWLSARWKKMNLVGVFFTFLVDTPFLVFIEFLEQWHYFLKEKTEDIR
ncbi:hypothetical protein J7K86_02305 [bacterium]|nr:hypothetical protein [bacterium]